MANIPLLTFYLGGFDIAGRSFEEILEKDDGWLEKTQDYIFWIFPTFRTDCDSVLDEETRALFKLPLMQERIKKAFRRMLTFYGFRYRPKIAISLSLWGERSKVWLNGEEHNFQRITRILQCLMLVGLKNEAKSFFEGLSEVFSSKENNNITKETFSSWKKTIKR